MIYAMKYDLMTFDEAFDLCMVQKILPKIGGSSSDTLEMLASIFEYINDYKIQNKEYMDENGIQYYGQVADIKIVKRSEITELPKEINELYYRIEVSSTCTMFKNKYK